VYPLQSDGPDALGAACAVSAPVGATVTLPDAAARIAECNPSEDGAALVIRLQRSIDRGALKLMAAHGDGEPEAVEVPQLVGWCRYRSFACPGDWAPETKLEDEPIPPDQATEATISPHEAAQ
jgi:hypothetical protein